MKIALVGLLISWPATTASCWSLALVHRGPGPSGRPGRGWRRLLATVRVEAIGVAILGVTAVLANGTPPTGHPPAPVPFAQTVPFDGGHVTFRITPNQALVNNITVQFTGPTARRRTGRERVRSTSSCPSQNVGPIEKDMKKVGVGRFVLANSPNPPIVGTWQIVLQIQVSEFSQPDVSFADSVQ